MKSPSATTRLPKNGSSSTCVPLKGVAFLTGRIRVPSSVTRPSWRRPAPPSAGQSPLSSQSTSTTLASKRTISSLGRPQLFAAWALAAIRKATAKPMAKNPLRMTLLPERLNAVLLMGQLDDSLISQHLADHQILEAVALVDAAVDGDPVGLDFEQAGIGKGGGAPLEPDDEIDLPILGQESHGNTAGRTPDGALMVSGALCVHDL